MVKHCAILFILLVLHQSSGKVCCQSCTEIQVGKTNVNVRLADHQFLEINDKLLHDCVRECLTLAHCKSFNYGQDNRVCELNDAGSTDVTVGQIQAANRYIYSDISAWPRSILGPCADHKCTGTQRCIPAKDGGHVCTETDCDEELPVGFTFVDSGTVTIGSVRTYKFDCAPGTLWEGVHQATCGINGKWLQLHNYCREIQNCSDVKQCNPSYSDGEYWLYPESFGGKRVKLFCHQMGSSEPSEYLSVDPDYNFSIDGGRDSITEEYKATTKFSKIRVDIKGMEVVRNDSTFTELIGNSYTNYAKAETCNCNWGCRHGSFSISTAGTGFTFSSTIAWSGFGWQPHVSAVTRNSENTELSATCGGYCGGCEPNEALLLYYDENTVVDAGSATLAKCI